MEEKKLEIFKPDGNSDKVSLLTYLLSDDGVRQYIVYSKSEAYGNEDDKIIYISKLSNEDNILSVSEIVDDIEWSEVQKLLRRIANSK